uniref:Coatomer subunit zeta n=1 Tax=Ditylenchus dipsaci TaxID=166011 RepID=A0A915DZL4_9BILA
MTDSYQSCRILDQGDGSRLAAKSFDKDVSNRKRFDTFEKNLFKKTHELMVLFYLYRLTEIILLDGLICVYRTNVDENELILVSVLNGLYDSISTVLRKNVEKRVFWITWMWLVSFAKRLSNNISSFTGFLIMDELCDDGVILETDAQAIVSRCVVRPDDLAFGDQSVPSLACLSLESTLIRKESLRDWALRIEKEVDEKSLTFYILLNNIDGRALRDPIQQKLSPFLLSFKSRSFNCHNRSCERDYALGSVFRNLYSFNWPGTFLDNESLWRRNVSRRIENPWVGYQASGWSHNMASLEVFWQATTQNSRKILQQLAIHAGSTKTRRVKRGPLLDAS